LGKTLCERQNTLFKYENNFFKYENTFFKYENTFFKYENTFFTMIINVTTGVTIMMIVLITILTIKLRKKNKEINLMGGFLPVQDQETIELNNTEEDVTTKTNSKV
jgi:hypothetical protein